MMPSVDVPGDNENTIDGWVRPKIMGRSGDCVGMTEQLAVWRFGAVPGSEFAKAYGVHSPKDMGFLWVLATRKTGRVREMFRGYAFEIPQKFRDVIEF
jgi:hypothetical protein